MKDTPKDCHCIHCDDNKEPKQSKSAFDMTDEEVASSVDLNTSDFDDSGDMLDELRDILEGNQ